MNIQPHQPNSIGIDQEQQANQQQQMDSASTNDQQNEDARTKKSKAPAELEEKEQEALVLCWKQSSGESFSFLCEWNPSTDQFDRKLQVNNKRLNDANVSIQLGDWYQISFVKFKNSNMHITIANNKCEEILDGRPFVTRIKDGIVQLNVPIWRVGPNFQSMLGEMPVREVPEQLNVGSDFNAWCQLKYKLVDNRNEYELCFVELDEKNAPEVDCEQQNAEEIQQQTLPNATSVNVNPIQKKMAKENQQQRGFSAGICGEEEKHSDFSLNFDQLSIDPNQIGQLTPPASEPDKPISKDFEDEVAVPEDLQLEVIRRTQRDQCRLELGEPGTNVVRVIGPDAFSVAKQLKDKRNQLLQERKEKENCSPPVQEVQPDSRPTSTAFGGTVQQRSRSRAESFKSRQEVQEVNHVPRSLNSVQPFALSAPDSTRKRFMPSSRASTPTRKCSTQKAPNTYRQVLAVPKEYRGFLVGSGGNKLKKLQSKYGVKMIVPREYSPADNPVEIIGTMDNVHQCKQAIEAMIRRLQNKKIPITRTMSIPSNAQRYISAYFAEMLNKFSVKCHFQNNQLVMIGNQEAQLNATVRALQALRPFIKRLEVPMEYRQQLMTNAFGGRKICNLEREYEVCIDIDEQQPQDGQQTVHLIVVGSEQMVERCVAFMQADMPASKIVKVPWEFRDHFLVRQLQRQHGVQIHFAPVQDHSNDVTVVGEATHVDACIRAILQKVTQIQTEELEKNSALSRATASNVRAAAPVADGIQRPAFASTSYHSLSATSNVRVAASMAGSNGFQRPASAATCFQSLRGTSSPMMKRGWPRR